MNLLLVVIFLGIGFLPTHGFGMHGSDELASSQGSDSDLMNIEASGEGDSDEFEIDDRLLEMSTEDAIRRLMALREQCNAKLGSLGLRPGDTDATRQHLINHYDLAGSCAEFVYWLNVATGQGMHVNAYGNEVVCWVAFFDDVAWLRFFAVLACLIGFDEDPQANGLDVLACLNQTYHSKKNQADWRGGVLACCSALSPVVVDATIRALALAGFTKESPLLVWLQENIKPRKNKIIVLGSPERKRVWRVSSFSFQGKL